MVTVKKVLIRDHLVEEYKRTHPGSQKWHEQAVRFFPGDGATHVERILDPFRPYITHARGSRKWDVDGNEYIDYVMGHGALILGHSHHVIVQVLQEQVAKGVHYSENSELEVEWAKLITSMMPYAELYTALQTGVVDGWIGGTLVDSMLWLDILDYFVQTRDRIDLENLFMNLELWNSLPKEDQDIIQSSAIEAQNWAWDWIEEEEKTWVAQAEAAGMEVAELAPEVMAEIVRRDHEIEWPFAEEELIGKEMMDAIRAHIE